MITRPILSRAIPAISLLLLLCLAFVTQGCSSHETPTSTAAEFKVALLTDGPVTDGGWNQSAYEALKAVGTKLGAKISNQQTEQSQFDSAFEAYAQQGYNVIFAHGDEFADSAARVAAKYPNTVFITTGGDKLSKNLAPIIFATEDGTYIQGMEAGFLSKTGVAGFVGGQNLPPVIRAANAFGLGMKAVNPKAVFIATYIDSWTDASKAKAQTDALIARNADMLAHNCDAAADGLFQSAAAKPGVYSFGVNSDQNDKAPNVLSSATLDIPKAFLDIASSVKAGTFRAAPLILGMKAGDVGIVDNAKFASLYSPAQTARIKQAEADIISGKLNITQLAR